MKKEKSGRGVLLKAPIITKILKLRESNLSMNEIQGITRVSKGSVNNVLQRAVKATIDSEKAKAMSEEELKKTFYPKKFCELPEDSPNFDDLKKEMTKAEVNAQLLWEEYQEQNPDGMKRSTFYDRLRHAGPENLITPSMHQTAKGGEKLMIDYSGLKTFYFDPKSGKKVMVD